MMNFPLAERMRPKSLDDFVGQESVVGPNAPLRKMIESGNMSSLLLWGPPGVGKTTLAMILAETIERPFYSLSAVDSGVKQVREILQKVEQTRFFDKAAPILFIDEIHRFNKTQQDALLKAVERGTVVLVGATTENPSFEVNSALLSRCQVLVLKNHSSEDLLAIAKRAIKDDVVLKQLDVIVTETEALMRISGGDARKLHNILEIVANYAKDDKIEITNQFIEEVVQQNISYYDKNGEQHYDIISAFIKSIRGSDPNAALYYLARMIAGGEDVKFICRRMIISASEDIGLANPNALLMATTTMQAAQVIGLPEARIILGQCAVYLAMSEKSNASYMGIGLAQSEIKASGDLSVPLSLRNAPTSLMKELGYGADYKYSHDHSGNFAKQQFLPKEIAGKVFYQPGENSVEQKNLKKLQALWENIYKY